MICVPFGAIVCLTTVTVTIVGFEHVELLDEMQFDFKRMLQICDSINKLFDKVPFEIGIRVGKSQSLGECNRSRVIALIYKLKMLESSKCVFVQAKPV